MQHTPGPWTIIRTASAHVGERAILDGEGYTVCNPSPMGEANARLIAAAPDMLAALREIVQGVHDEFSSSHPLHAAADRARAAIAQAEGDA